MEPIELDDLSHLLEIIEMQKDRGQINQLEYLKEGLEMILEAEVTVRKEIEEIEKKKHKSVTN